jgi:hypothetical protein
VNLYTTTPPYAFMRITYALIYLQFCNCNSLKFSRTVCKILFYTSIWGVVHLSKRYISKSLFLDFYTVAAWVFVCCFPYVSPLSWLRLQYVRILTNVNYVIDYRIQHFKSRNIAVTCDVKKWAFVTVEEFWHS